MKHRVNILPPKKDESSMWYRMKVGCLVVIQCLLWPILLITSINVFVYYLCCIFTKGFFDEETLKFAIFLIIGTYFFLILDKKKICESLRIKTNMPFINEEK